MKVTEKAHYIRKDCYDVFVTCLFFSVCCPHYGTRVSSGALGTRQSGRPARSVTSIHERTILFVNRSDATGPCTSFLLLWLQRCGITSNSLSPSLLICKAGLQQHPRLTGSLWGPQRPHTHFALHLAHSRPAQAVVATAVTQVRKLCL